MGQKFLSQTAHHRQVSQQRTIQNIAGDETGTQQCQQTGRKYQ